MRFLPVALLLCWSASLFAETAAPNKQELGLTLGVLRGSTRTSGGTTVDLGSGLALGANYGVRLRSGEHAALYGEFHFLANGLRDISSANRGVIRDVATLYATPGIRVKFLPSRAFSPYVAIGGGYALYEQSHNRLDGQPNPASRFTHRGAFMYGGGVDSKLWRFIGLRAEVRDFYSGSPSYNVPSIRGGQHNVTVGGGLVVRLR